MVGLSDSRTRDRTCTPVTRVPMRWDLQKPTLQNGKKGDSRWGPARCVFSVMLVGQSDLDARFAAPKVVGLGKLLSLSEFGSYKISYSSLSGGLETLTTD